jgi:hypothetical protein
MTRSEYKEVNYQATVDEIGVMRASNKAINVKREAWLQCAGLLLYLLNNL